MTARALTWGSAIRWTLSPKGVCLRESGLYYGKYANGEFNTEEFDPLHTRGTVSETNTASNHNGEERCFRILENLIKVKCIKNAAHTAF